MPKRALVGILYTPSEPAVRRGKFLVFSLFKTSTCIAWHVPCFKESGQRQTGRSLRLQQGWIMLTTLKLKSIAVAAGAVAAMAAAAPANAFVYAMSHLDLQNLVLDVTGAGTGINSYTFNLANTASMNGPASVSSAACNSFGFPACSNASPVLDANAANAGGSTLNRTNNNFAFLGTAGNNSYSGSDSVVKTAELVQGVPTNIEQIAESLLNINGFAAANAEIQSNTSLTATVNVVSGAALTLDFDADPDQRSQVQGLAGGYLSQSNLNASFTLTRSSTDGGGSVSWAPQGTGATNDCTVSGALFGVATCVETADTQDLNFNTSTSVNPSTTDNSFDIASLLTHFGINITGLPTATYTIAFNAVTSTSIVRQVPEPGTVGLIGAALLGLAMTSVRRGRKQQ